MLFTSINFMLFVALALGAYYLSPQRHRWVILLVASYVFYGIADLHFLAYIILATVSVYFGGIQLQKLNEEKAKRIADEEDRASKKLIKQEFERKQQTIFLLSLLFNLGLLGFVKYFNFFLKNINALMSAFGTGRTFEYWNIIAVMGISFYIFQSISYLIDVKRGKIKAQQNFFKLALFVSFFPQLVQGPISRYDDLSKTLYSGNDFEWQNFKFGIQRILWGLFKKLVLADRLSVVVITLVKSPDQYDGAYVFAAMLLYAYQLYADFTGGIDVTIGVAQLFGVKVKENFDRPYFSKNIAEYWRRWHISMGTWFKDYVFYPFSVSNFMMNFTKFSRKKFGNGIGKRLPVYVTTLVLWFTTGFWHGASYNFIVWGLANGFVIIGSIELKPLFDKFHATFDVKDKRSFHVFQVIRTILLMSSIRMFDVYADVPLTFKMLFSMVTKWNYHELFSSKMLELGIGLLDYCVLFFGLILLITVSLAKGKGSVREQVASLNTWSRHAIYYGMAFVIIIFGMYGVGFDASQFIYNKF